jgi:hypothetical protein
MPDDALGLVLQGLGFDAADAAVTARTSEGVLVFATRVSKKDECLL